LGDSRQIMKHMLYALDPVAKFNRYRHGARAEKKNRKKHYVR